MRAKEWICRGLVMLLVPLMAVPCVASGEAKANLLGATPLDSGSVNHIELGEAVCILLSENQTTPYRWEYVISDETAMQGLYDEYTSDPNPLGMDGVGGKHRFYFIATSTGACSINMRLLRIGADKEDASQEVTYTVMIEEPAAKEGDDGNYLYTDQAEFCGCWYAMPYLGSRASSISGVDPGSTCYDARYLFDADGTFVYGCDEADGLNRVRYVAGNWYVEENRLYLEIWERIVWEGGREVAASGSIRTERMIENPTVRLIGYDEPELEAYDITGPVSPAELGGLETAGREVIEIDGQVFFGFGNNKGLLNGFWEMKKLADSPASEAGVPLFTFLDDPALTAFAMNFETDFPVSVSVRHDGEAGGIPDTQTDPETIRAVFVALRQITVLDKWPASGHTDDYLNYYFEMADGRVIYGFEFQDGMLLDGGLGLYEITGFDALQQALPDPGL